MLEPAYPNILAVDPINCGCTECLIGEYVNEDTWVANANSIDVYNVLTGTVRNNTYQPVFDLVFYANYIDNTAVRFVKEIRGNFVELVNGNVTLDDLAEKVSWEV